MFEPITSTIYNQLQSNLNIFNQHQKKNIKNTGNTNDMQTSKSKKNNIQLNKKINVPNSISNKNNINNGVHKATLTQHTSNNIKKTILHNFTNILVKDILNIDDYDLGENFKDNILSSTHIKYHYSYSKLLEQISTVLNPIK